MKIGISIWLLFSIPHVANGQHYSKWVPDRLINGLMQFVVNHKAFFITEGYRVPKKMSVYIQPRPLDSIALFQPDTMWRKDNAKPRLYDEEHGIVPRFNYFYQFPHLFTQQDSLYFIQQFQQAKPVLWTFKSKNVQFTQRACAQFSFTLPLFTKDHRHAVIRVASLEACEDGMPYWATQSFYLYLDKQMQWHIEKSTGFWN